MDIKPWHIGSFFVLIIVCFFVVLNVDPFKASSNHVSIHDNIINTEKRTVPIRFKRRKDIPNQCFPLTETVNGCLPSVIVLGPSIEEKRNIIDILESHPGLNNGNEPKVEYHITRTQQSFFNYFQSFPTENGKIFTYYDISSSYLYDHGAPASIRQVAPTTVFLVPLMNPVDRVISQFFSQTQNLPESCYNVPIEDYLQEEIDMLKHCDIPINFPSTNWKANAVPSQCSLITKDCAAFKWDSLTNSYSVMSNGAFLSESFYSNHLNHWYEYFDRKQFYVVDMESLYHPKPSLWNFLGADPELWLQELAEFEIPKPYRNAISSKTNSWLHKTFEPSVKALYNQYLHISFDSF